MANEGLIPPGGAGTFAKLHNSQKRVAAAILDADEDDNESEWNESYLAFKAAICEHCDEDEDPLLPRCNGM